MNKKIGTKRQGGFYLVTLANLWALEVKNFYEKLAEWCFRRPSVAIAILKKFIPDKTHAEIEIPEDPESAMAKARESLKKKLNDISKRLGDIDHIRPKESNEKSIKEK